MKTPNSKSSISHIFPRTSFSLKSVLFVAGFMWSVNYALASEEELALEKFLQSYVATEDAAYQWNIEQDVKTERIRYVLIDLVSQTWLSSDEVDRPQWKHWLEIFIPNDRQSDVPLLFIAGGSNSSEKPSSTNSMGQQIALVSGTIVAHLSQVPNQPLVLLNDGRRRSEDDLISFSWTQYLKTDRLEWLAQAPMVKSASRAMDAVTEVLSSDEMGSLEVENFIVAGGSKRGWTTWLTAAVDSRVVAIVPVVFDVLNMRESMKHHFGAYGFWSASLGDYVDQGIFQQFESEKLDPIFRVVDPYTYRNELDIPKFIVNASGDEFFLLDSSQFYWNHLVGPKYLRYVPNTDHGLSGSDALLSIAAFVSLVSQDKPIPSISWSRQGTNRIEVKASHKPSKVNVWETHNPISRDFRLLRGPNGNPRGPVFTSRSILPSSEDGLSFEASVQEPASGWTAWTMEFTFDVGLTVPLKLSTDIQVLPTDLPFAQKDFTLDNFITIHCHRNQEDEQASKRILDFIDGTVGSPNTAHKNVANRDYYTWKTTGDLQEEGVAVSRFIDSLGYEECDYQLESGGGPTLPPLQSMEN